MPPDSTEKTTLQVVTRAFDDAMAAHREIIIQAIKSSIAKGCFRAEFSYLHDNMKKELKYNGYYVDDACLDLFIVSWNDVQPEEGQLDDDDELLADDMDAYDDHIRPYDFEGDALH